MERAYRTSNGLYLYAFFLVLTAALLGLEAIQRLRTGSGGWGVFLALLALCWAGCAAYLIARWGRVRIAVRSDALSVTGDGPERRFSWTDVERVREFRGPAYQLSLRGLLPGPYLPHGLVRGETVLAIDLRAATRMLFRQALVDSYAAFRQDVVRSSGRDIEVDLHARWWRVDAPPEIERDAEAYDDDDERADARRAREERAARDQLLGTRQAPSGSAPRARRGRAGGGGFDR